MKKNELQKVLKPLIKQCIKEVIFEEGVLSGLISEVVQGLGGQQTIVEAKAPEMDFSRQQVELQEEAKAEMSERRKKLEESLGGAFSGVFETTQPLARGGTVGESPSQSPLANYAPNDPGVDISGIMSLGAGSNWKKMI